MQQLRLSTLYSEYWTKRLLLLIKQILKNINNEIFVRTTQYNIKKTEVFIKWYTIKTQESFVILAQGYIFINKR